MFLPSQNIEFITLGCDIVPSAPAEIYQQDLSKQDGNHPGGYWQVMHIQQIVSLFLSKYATCIQHDNFLENYGTFCHLQKTCIFVRLSFFKHLVAKCTEKWRYRIKMQQVKINNTNSVPIDIFKELMQIKVLPLLLSTASLYSIFYHI